MIYARLPKKFMKSVSAVIDISAVALGLPEDLNLLIVNTDKIGNSAEALPEQEFEIGRFYAIRFGNERLKKTNEEGFVKDLAHELTHIKQFLKDGLELDAVNEVATFKDKEYRFSNEMEYWFAPWEIEARGMELAIWHVYAGNWEKYV